MDPSAKTDVFGEQGSMVNAGSRTSIVGALLALITVFTFGQPTQARDTGNRSDDPALTSNACGLLGRLYDAGLGCARHRCVAGATMMVGSFNAEVCALGHGQAHGFALPIDFRRCRALHRRWIAPVNWCASNPVRSATVIERAAQCTEPFSTYVTLDEVEGRYDECWRPSGVAELRRIAETSGTTLRIEALRHSKVQCAFRPGHSFVDGECERSDPEHAVRGGVLLVGDSITWRGTDEIASLMPNLVLDGLPGRRLSDLRDRLDWFQGSRGEPDGLILELGANAARGFRSSELAHTIASLPIETDVLLTLPYRVSPSPPLVVAPFTLKYAAWLRALAADRPRTCVADWPEFVGEHPKVLQDGVHATRPGEVVWARWMAKQWRHCRHDVSAGRS